MTADHQITIEGSTAHLNAQFVMFEVQPDTTIRAAESGYYDTDVVLIEGDWLIAGHRILLDVLPAAAR